jgi:hypothetical protein
MHDETPHLPPQPFPLPYPTLPLKKEKEKGRVCTCWERGNKALTCVHMIHVC